jgi:2-methylisocitrate lyase-like PEP mutase family enzyme
VTDKIDELAEQSRAYHAERRAQVCLEAGAELLCIEVGVEETVRRLRDMADFLSELT